MGQERQGYEDAPPLQRSRVTPRLLSGRGLSYWSDGREERILYVTPGYRLIALDAKTGIPVPTFGKSGAVDLKMDDDQTIDLITGEVEFSPLVGERPSKHGTFKATRAE